MAKLLQVDFEFHGPFGEKMAAKLKELAQSINTEPGMIWKIWTESVAESRGGGIYLFEDQNSAQTYLDMHTARLKAMGVNSVRGMVFDVNETLSAINQGPINRGEGGDE